MQQTWRLAIASAAGLALCYSSKRARGAEERNRFETCGRVEMMCGHSNDTRRNL